MTIQQQPEVMTGGFILRANRKRIGFTQEQVAEMMDMSLRTYQGWERDRSDPSFGDVMAICECVFKIDVLDAIVVAQEAKDEH
ncbi:MAG: transcriptional regulator [Rheinheimera sp.]|uniref:helix-turn-helix domain-containing protein n=1 Tax=Arsukibacterium sp. UBA3155 TaxID=1946058 RepID=UPI000C9678D6|nr:helix-turn-helix transcriptional regulator [Arsukibacterium sp. UBA3155]MAD75143.1 transcriptional regulator [Rheinheimera sp.]|tara:strand:- start:44143 stop:44391 length:249 start_codon:yes stop_codon:yes gene_type:complete